MTKQLKQRAHIIFILACCTFLSWPAPTHAKTKTIGSAEDLLFGQENEKLHNENKPLPPGKKQRSQSSNLPRKPNKKITKSASASPSPPLAKNDGPISAMMNNVRLEFHGCKYDAHTRSSVCSMELTSLQQTSEVTLLCYSGTQASDSNGATKECAHVWLEDNHSWNYSNATLEQGKPIRAMARFKTGSYVKSLNMQYVFSVDNNRKMISLQDVLIQR